MMTSLAQGIEAPRSALEPVLATLVGRPIRRLQSVGGGRNSRIYQIVCDDGSMFCAKHYFNHQRDTRNRLEVESEALRFLWGHGVRDIPRPVASDRERNVAVYEWIEGVDVPTNALTTRSIDEAVEFLSRLKALRAEAASRELPAASEACLSLEAAVRHVERRLARLSAVSSDPSSPQAFRVFLNEGLRPLFDEVVRSSHGRAQRAGWSFTAELALEASTLSPSDFGFHNALRRADGRLAFLDFEYFGWDDPAKMLSDFLLHPAMQIPEALKHRFAAGVFNCFGELPVLPERAALMYPLCALKWCTILLNEFVPEHLDRRRFANDREVSGEQLLDRQLAKAQRMLEHARAADGFPYGARS